MSLDFSQQILTFKAHHKSILYSYGWIKQTKPNQLMIKNIDRLYFVDIEEAWQIINDIEIDENCNVNCFKTPRFDPIERPYYFDGLTLANS